MPGLLGQKKGMTQIFNEAGEMIPVTVVQAGPCVVVDTRTKERDGYEALQLGFLPAKEKHVSKPLQGHFKARKVNPFRVLREFRLEGAAELPEGATLTANLFRVGDIVHVRGVTKGRGFQGVMKRHGKHGGPAAHGSDFHRRPGSIGMRTQPGRVPKNMRLPGHMGVDWIITKNLQVVGVRPEDNVLLIRGALPGAINGFLEIIADDKTWLKRLTETKTEGSAA